MILFLTFVILLQGTLGELVCEDLPVGMCSYSIASSGKRCTLENTFEFDDGTPRLLCKTSQIMANAMHEYIESDACVHTCGVDRNSIGISSDALLETRFTSQICSLKCFHYCPNIVDLYYNLALAEGVLLDELCKFQETSPRRSAIQLQSSSATAALAPAGSAGGSSSVDCALPPM